MKITGKGALRASLVVEAIIGLTIISIACLLVYQTCHLVQSSTNFDASRRQAQDLVDARVFAWRGGTALVVETGTLPSGSKYRLTPDAVTSNGVDQLRIEVIWSMVDPLPASGAGWPWRCVGMATRIPSS